jgi:hypothetical protein
MTKKQKLVLWQTCAQIAQECGFHHKGEQYLARCADLQRVKRRNKTASQVEVN